MKYKITLNGRTYEVEVDQDQAMLVDEYEAYAPAPAAPAAAPAAGGRAAGAAAAGTGCRCAGGAAAAAASGIVRPGRHRICIVFARCIGRTSGCGRPWRRTGRCPGCRRALRITAVFFLIHLKLGRCQGQLILQQLHLLPKPLVFFQLTLILFDPPLLALTPDTAAGIGLAYLSLE